MRALARFSTHGGTKKGIANPFLCLGGFGGASAGVAQRARYMIPRPRFLPRETQSIHPW